MLTAQHVSFEQLSQRIEQGHRKALVRTFVLSFATVAVAAAFLVLTLRELESANQQLNTVMSQISTAKEAEEKAQAELQTAQEDLKSAVTQATKLQEQVATLEAELATSKKALAEALDLSQHVYKLDWGGMKMMYVEYGRAANVLGTIEQLKDQVHWDVSSTSTGGYNSPGFARLILQRLGLMGAQSNLASLPQDGGPPGVGDIVVYESGYHLFYFRDHASREFVVGMTPFGVVSLDYDFGVKRTAILRTGLSP